MFKFYHLAKHFKMRCPKCFRILVKGEDRKFSNSLDHAFDPNHEYERSMRITFSCPHCFYAVYSFYDEDGAFYVTNYDKLSEVILWRDRKKYYRAIFSWEWFQQIDQWFWWRKVYIDDKIRVLRGEKSIFAKKEKK